LWNRLHKYKSLNFTSSHGGEIFPGESNLLNKEDLLKGFQLSKADANIVFDNTSSELYKIDLDETRADFTPSFVKLDGEIKDRLMEYILRSIKERKSN
jgi:type III restriction enzyme